MYPFLPVFSIRLARLTVSPNSWNRDFSPRRTPAVTGPLCRPTGEDQNGKRIRGERQTSSVRITRRHHNTKKPLRSKHVYRKGNLQRMVRSPVPGPRVVSSLWVNPVTVLNDSRANFAIRMAWSCCGSGRPVTFQFIDHGKARASEKASENVILAQLRANH